MYHAEYGLAPLKASNGFVHFTTAISPSYIMKVFFVKQQSTVLRRKS